MLKQRILAQTAILVLCVCSMAWAQEPAPPAPAPRLVRFSGALKDRLGRARTGVTGLTLALYKDQEGGAPLWLETQNVELDEQGRYVVLLGATRSDGLPLELFTTGEQRWLGVQVILPGVEEEPRVLLVSVPYALKAADAETLGGKPLGAFVLAPPAAAGSNRSPSTPTSPLRTTPPAAVSGTGTTNRVTKWLDGPNGVLADSAVFESNGNVGIGAPIPLSGLDVLGPTGASSWYYFRGNVDGAPNPSASATNGLMLGWNPSAGQGETQILYATASGGAPRLDIGRWSGSAKQIDFTLRNGNVGIGPTTPAERLEVAGNTNVTGYAHLGNSSPNSFPSTQGAYIGWNRSQSLGEVNLINHSGGGPGSGSFFFDKTSNGSTFTRLLTISGTGGIIFPDGSTQKTACDTFAFGNVKPSGSANGILGLFPSGGPLRPLHLGPPLVPGALETTSCSAGGIAALLVEAIQRQDAQIRQLQAEIEVLKARAGLRDEIAKR